MSWPLTLLTDKRAIESIQITNVEMYYPYKVGENGVTHIEAYGENEQGALVPWFAIFSGDEVASRVNGAMVESVEYAKVTR